ncbi:tetratricopeptide repeat protein [Acetoanaerobium sticklandii]|uniref:tetratricopeptide repeat protein n=1 Tax=Acetoanaerobium sticklandii TaxID=1511 RepID=UPI003A92FBF1
MNKSRIEKYLLEKTNKLIFITLDDIILKKIEGININKNIEVPVFSSVLIDMANSKKEGISTIDILSAMLFIQGIDPYFKYSREYKAIITKLSSNPLALASSLAGDAYEKNNLIESLIFARGYLAMFEPEINLYFNYALLCKEISEQALEDSKKVDFKLESEDCFNSLVQLYPEFSKPYYYLAYFALQHRDLSASKNYFEKAIELGLDDSLENDSKDNLLKIKTTENISLSIELIEREKYNEAIAVLEEIVDEDTSSYEAYFYLGYINRLKGEYESAIDYFEFAYKLDTSQPQLINEMALCFAFLGDFEQALELLEYAFELDSESIEILCNISMVYYNLENIEKAKYYINLAENINPHDDIVQECIKLIYKA